MIYLYIQIKNLCPVLVSFFVTIVKRRRLFNKHRRLCIAIISFLEHIHVDFLYQRQRMFSKHRKHDVNNMLDLTCIAQNNPLTI